MSDSDNWATAVPLADRLLGRRATAISDDARILVERLTGHVMLSSGPAETFSKEMPVYVGPATEGDLAPIDILYGCYSPNDLRIKIFVNRISTDAPRFKAEFPDLLTVVRIHEYAHAVVHTGINTADVSEQLAKLGIGGTTDWESFRADRDRAFSALDNDCHELLAQAIACACISREPVSPRSQRLIETFLALEEQQPQRYQLPSEVKQCAHLADWGVVLRAARGELDVHRGPSFNFAAGLAALIRKTAERRGARG